MEVTSSFVTNSTKHILSVLAVVLLFGCGGGSGSGDDGETDNLDYRLQELFPTPGSNLGGALDITVSGRVINNVNSPVDLNQISSLTVNGITVDMDNSDPGFWSALLPVNANQNIIDITMTYGSNQTESLSYEIRNSPIMKEPSGIFYNQADDKLWLLDATFSRILEVDLQSRLRNLNPLLEYSPVFYTPTFAIDNGNYGYFTLFNESNLYRVNINSGIQDIISGNLNGSGPAIDNPSDIVFESSQSKIYLVGSVSGVGYLMSVDINSGNRLIISDSTQGTGNTLKYPVALEVDILNNRAIVIDQTDNAIIEVDLATGNRSIISNAITGVGTDFLFPVDISLDLARNLGYVLDGQDNILISVDLTTGDRTVISGGAEGSGEVFSGLKNLAINSTDNTAYVTDYSSNSFFEVDLSSGTRNVFDDDSIGQGIKFEVPEGVVLDSKGNRAIVIDSVAEALISVDLRNGNRETISGSGVGIGPAMDNPTDVVVDADNNLAYVSDYITDTVISIDLQSGNRETVFGPGLDNPHELIFIKDSQLLYVIEDQMSITALNLESGMISTVSGYGVGNGTDFENISGMEVDSINDRILVVDAYLKALFEVDIQSGDRNILSGMGIGTGIDLDNPTSIAIDSANNRVLVSDFSYPGIFEIDLQSGDRTLVSSLGEGHDMKSPSDIFFDEENNRALVVEGSDVIPSDTMILINTQSWDRTIVTN